MTIGLPVAEELEVAILLVPVVNKESSKSTTVEHERRLQRLEYEWENPAAVIEGCEDIWFDVSGLKAF